MKIMTMRSPTGPARAMLEITKPTTPTKARIIAIFWCGPDNPSILLPETLPILNRSYYGNVRPQPHYGKLMHASSRRRKNVDINFVRMPE